MKDKNILISLLGLGLLLFSFNSVAATTTVDVTANIMSIHDPGNVLTDLNIGPEITVNYTYDDSTADNNPDPLIGSYIPAPGTGEMNVSLGNTQLSTLSHAETPFINIVDEAWQAHEYYDVDSSSFVENNSIQLDMVGIHLKGDTGQALNGDQLVSFVLELNNFNIDKTLHISGSRFGQYFQIHAEISQLVANQGPQEPTPKKISYKATAQVDWIDDYMGGLGNQLNVGQLVTITYTYDTGTPDNDANPEHGFYQHTPGSGSMKVELPDGSSFESTLPFDVLIGNSSWSDYMHIHGGDAHSSNPIFSGTSTSIYFDGGEYAISSDSLPGEDMQLSDWFDGFFYANNPLNGWSFNAKIVSLELIEFDAVVSVPGNANIHPMQRFDAAFYVTDPQPVQGISGTLNNMPINYQLASCNIFPSSTNEHVVLCPYMHELLMPGENTINLQFHLMDSSIIEKTVIWTLIQP